jgi:hypothetical protein
VIERTWQVKKIKKHHPAGQWQPGPSSDFWSLGIKVLRLARSSETLVKSLFSLFKPEKILKTFTIFSAPLGSNKEGLTVF